MKKVGKPTKYVPIETAKQAKNLCLLHGYTDVKLAKHFGVHRDTISVWKKDYPEFKQAVQEGKDHWDTEKVEKAALKSAIGGKTTEVTRELAVETLARELYKLAKDDAETNKIINLLKRIPPKLFIVTKKITKDFLPDRTLNIFHRKNRNPDRWKDVAKVNIIHEVDQELWNAFLSVLNPQQEQQFKAKVLKLVSNRDQ